MLRFLADENLNYAIVRGLLQREPALDIIRVQDTSVAEQDDPTVLEWTAIHDRILVTHDAKTVPGYAYARMSAGKPMAGVFVIPDRMSIGLAIDDLLLAAVCSEPDEWVGVVVRFPL